MKRISRWLVNLRLKWPKSLPAAPASSSTAQSTSACSTCMVRWRICKNVSRGCEMAIRKMGTLTIGQAPRSDITPILDAALPSHVRCLHAGVLDGLDDAAIAARFFAATGRRPPDVTPAGRTRRGDGQTRCRCCVTAKDRRPRKHKAARSSLFSAPVSFTACTAKKHRVDRAGSDPAANVERALVGGSPGRGSSCRSNHKSPVSWKNGAVRTRHRYLLSPRPILPAKKRWQRPPVRLKRRARK